MRRMGKRAASPWTAALGVGRGANTKLNLVLLFDMQSHRNSDTARQRLKHRTVFSNEAMRLAMLQNALLVPRQSSSRLKLCPRDASASPSGSARTLADHWPQFAANSHAVLSSCSNRQLPANSRRLLQSARGAPQSDVRA